MQDKRFLVAKNRFVMDDKTGRIITYDFSDGPKDNLHKICGELNYMYDNELEALKDKIISLRSAGYLSAEWPTTKPKAYTSTVELQKMLEKHEEESDESIVLFAKGNNTIQ
jgi:hypothetical protein